MTQRSQHYRNDEAAGLDPEIRDYLDREYLQHLRNINRSNPKLLVVFSGGNAMGKTTISLKIEQRFGGLVLENDGVKRCLLRKMPDASRDVLSPLTWKYTMDLYGRLDSITPNGLIVRDGVIDWYYDRILPLFKAAGYQLFVVGFDISRQKAIELIRARGDTPTVKEDRFYVLLDDHDVHIKRFRAHHTPDYVLTDSTIFDHDPLLAALAERIANYDV